MRLLRTHLSRTDLRRKVRCALVATAALGLCGASVLAGEKTLWKLGEPDRSDHEFTAFPDARTNQPAVVRVGVAEGIKRWPRFHPGSGNGAFGGRRYEFTAVFDLPAQTPRGVFFLDLSLLFRQPRVPAVQVDVNGHQGRYYFDPEPMAEVGNGDDQFNPIRSAGRRKLALPAGWFRPGENRLTLAAVDESSYISRNRNVGGSGDSGFFYDSLALTQDPDAAMEQRLEAELTPTVLYPRSGKQVSEECQLTIRFPSSWPGGKARVTVGKFTAEVATPKPAESGEARFTVLVPEKIPAGPARIELIGLGQAGSAIFETPFRPARKWKLFYAPSMHLDIGYTDYRPKVAETHARGLDDLLNVLDAHPSYRFNVDGSWIAEQWLATRSGDQAARFARHARAGRVGMNALYSSFVTDYPSFEAFVRNLYFSKQLQRDYGVPFDFGIITDIPGNSWSVPSVLASAGIKYFADGANQDRGPLIVQGHWNTRSPFWWEGPDGQRVLTWYSSHYHQLKALCGLPPAIESGRGGVAAYLRIFENAGYVPDAVLVYGTEVENLPLEFDDAGFVEQWRAQYAYPQLITCRFAEFFEYIEKHYAKALPVVRGEAGAYWGDNAGIFASGTARDRGNQTRVISAETLATLTATIDPKLRFPLELDHEIWRNMLLFTEHTYGSHRTRGQPEHDEAIGQLRDKEDQTVRAEGDIDKLMRRGMSQLADQVATEGKNLVVFNPLSWPRSGLVRFMVDDGTVLTNLATGQAVSYEVLSKKDGATSIRFLAENVPALGYQVYRMGRGKAIAPASGDSTAGKVIENRFYRVTLEPASAAIKSIFDKELGRELVDSSGSFLLNEYLFVSGGGTETGRGSGAENSRLLNFWPWLPPGELKIHHPSQGTLVSVEKTTWGTRAVMTASATHTPRIEAEILLRDDVKRIELRNVIQVDLLYAKQASYFAFPWAMAKPTFRYEIANGFVNPEKDLFQGGCSEWFSLQHLVNVEDGKTSVDLAVADSPLVCLDDIYRGTWPGKFTPKSPTVFSYVLNNYWSPKWSGRKTMELVNRYAITSNARFQEDASARFGRDACTALEVSEIKSSDKLQDLRGFLPGRQASLATIAPDNLAITVLKAAEDGKGLIVRVAELAGRETDGTLRLPFAEISSACEASAVETPGKALKTERDSLRLHLRPHQVLTVRLTTKPAPPARSNGIRITIAGAASSAE